MEETLAPALTCTFKFNDEDGQVQCTVKRHVCPICRQCLPRNEESPKSSYDCPGHLGVIGWRPTYAHSQTVKNKKGS